MTKDEVERLAERASVYVIGIDGADWNLGAALRALLARAEAAEAQLRVADAGLDGIVEKAREEALREASRMVRSGHAIFNKSKAGPVVFSAIATLNTAADAILALIEKPDGG